jgi:hypothetical protein
MLESMCARWRVRRLIRHWEALRERVRGAWDAAAIAPEQEREFLRLQTRIAAQLPWLEDAVPDGDAAAARRHVEGITALLTRHRALVAGLPAPEREQFEREWHEHFLFLGEVRGMRLASPARRRGGSVHVRGTDRVPTGMPRYHRMETHPLGNALRFVIQLGFLLLLVYLLARAIGFCRGVDGRLKVEVPESLGGFWQNMLAGAQSIRLGLGALLQPVVHAYGLTLTLVLFGVLVLAVVYGLFGRGRG